MQPERLADLEEIKQLKARYFRLMDTKDWEAFADVFTEDCVIHNGPSDQPPVRGRAALVEYVSSSIQHMITVHHGHMPEIEFVSADEATGIWAMYDRLRAPGLSMDGYGHYHETYQRCTDGRWRISYTRLSRLWLNSSNPAMTAGLWPEAPEWALPS